MIKLNVFIFFTIIALLYSCTIDKNKSSLVNQSSFTFTVENLSDEMYPDNPDIGFRSKNYQNNYFS